MTGLPKAILFDLDQTILSFGNRRLQLIEVAEQFADFFAPIPSGDAGVAIETAFREFWSDEARHKLWRFKLFEARVQIVTDLFESWKDQAPRLSTDVAIQFAERFHEYREAQAKFFPGALEAIEEFKRLGVKLALVTNGAADAQREKIDRFDLSRRFDHVQIEGEAGFGKPEERAYLHAMEILGVEAHETWMVGDNLEWEVAAPQRLGIYAIWHDHRGEGLPAGNSVVPDRTIRSLTELVPLERDQIGTMER